MTKSMGGIDGPHGYMYMLYICVCMSIYIYIDIYMLPRIYIQYN
jgi:hypothetical protein